jgi:hypothetical protein
MEFYYNEYKTFIMNKLEEVNSILSLDILQKLKDMQNEDLRSITEFVGVLYEAENIRLMLYGDWYRYVKIFED